MNRSGILDGTRLAGGVIYSYSPLQKTSHMSPQGGSMTLIHTHCLHCTPIFNVRPLLIVHRCSLYITVCCILIFTVPDLQQCYMITFYPVCQMTFYHVCQMPFCPICLMPFYHVCQMPFCPVCLMPFYPVC